MYDILRLPDRIPLGRAGTAGQVTLRFDLRPWKHFFSDVSFNVCVVRPGETEADAYFPDTYVENDALVWNVGYADTEKTGIGHMEVHAVSTETQALYAKTRMTEIEIAESASGSAGETPEPAEPWTARVEAAAAQAAASEASAESAAESASSDADRAESAMLDAVTAKTAAETSAYAAEVSMESADASAGSALASKTAAVNAAASALESKTSALESKTSALASAASAAASAEAAEEAEAHFSSKLDKNQGAANVGKLMAVSGSGEVLPKTVDGGNLYVDESAAVRTTVKDALANTPGVTWKLLAHIVLDEATNSFSLTKDADGAAFNAQEVFITGKCFHANESSQGTAPFILSVNTDSGDHSMIRLANALVPYNESRTINTFACEVRATAPRISAVAAAYDTSEYSARNIEFGSHNAHDFINRGISKLQIRTNAGTKYRAGSEFTIYYR